MASLPSIVQTFKPGTKLVTENDSASRKMYIIRSGKARVFKTYMGQRITLAVLGAGEVFGEMSFFDAEPRSASVEALTEMTAIVLDGDTVRREVEGLPDWVYPIFRTVFHRFREMDAKMTVLQSMNEFQRRAFRTDNVARTIYLDVLRFNKTLKLLHDRDAALGPVKSEKLYSEFDDMLGARSVGLRVFWRMLKEFDFIDHKKEEDDGVVVLNERALGELNKYLGSEVESETFLFLSHSSVAILGKIVGYTHADEHADEAQDPTTILFEDIGLDRVPLYKEALVELSERKILKVTERSITAEPGRIYHLFTYQSILKAFDHTFVNVD